MTQSSGDTTQSPQSEGASASVESARRVLRLEIEGLDILSRHLDGPFSETIGLLARTKGRVVVTGMGKSGHVARKIAATFASTGTPALYVHPGEASHGDLGMIAREDAILALSNSGETDELADLVAYAKRFEIPLIAVTSVARSTLADAATHALILPEASEACPLGLAPTTSTTMMMALGDALAVALLEHKGFSSDDFHVLHPGGKLGQRLLKVRDLMHEGDEVPLVGGTMSMADALLVMTHKSFGCIGVVDDDRVLLGIVTDGDLRRHMSPDLLAKSVMDVMTRAPKTIGSRAVASEAVRIMNERSITALFVVDDTRAVGLLHIHDCLRAGVA